MPTQRPPGKLAERVREVVSTPARRGVPQLAPGRVAQPGRRAAGPAARRGGTPGGPAPATSFEFGSLSVDAGRDAGAPAGEPGRAPPPAAGAPKVAAKVPGAPAPPRDPANAAARASTPPPAAAAALGTSGPAGSTPVLASPATSDLASPATSDLASPATPDLASPATPDLSSRASPDLAPPAAPDLVTRAHASPLAPAPAVPAAPAAAAHHEAPAGAGAGGWGPVFEGLGAVAAAILARLDASRAGPPAPHEAPLADRTASAARERADAEWSARLDALRRMARELSTGSREARQAALGAELRPDAAAAAPFAAEAARLGEVAQLVAAALGAVRGVREALRSQPSASAQVHAERMAPRWAEVEALLAQLEAGSPVPGAEVDAAAAGAGGALVGAGDGLLAGAAEIHRAFREGVAAPGAPPAGADARLERAAALLSSAGGETPAAAAGPAPPPAAAPAPPAAPAPAPIAPIAKPPAGAARALRDEGHEPGPAPGLAPGLAHSPADARRERTEGRPKPERPATWELRVARSSTEVGLADVAKVLGAARLEDVRDVLREGLATRHQFVVWTRVGTTLDDALRAAVNEGLVETRTQDAQERPPRGSA